MTGGVCACTALAAKAICATATIPAIHLPRDDAFIGAPLRSFVLTCIRIDWARHANGVLRERQYPQMPFRTVSIVNATDSGERMAWSRRARQSTEFVGAAF